MKKLTLSIFLVLCLVGVAFAGSPIYFGGFGVQGGVSYFDDGGFVDTFTGTGRLDEHTPDETVFNKSFPWTSSTGTINGAARHTESLGAEAIPFQADRDFSGGDNWTNQNIPVIDKTGDLSITANSAGQFVYLSGPHATTVVNSSYKLSLDVANIVEAWRIRTIPNTTTLAFITDLDSDGSNTFYYKAVDTGGISLISLTATSSGDFDNFTLKPITISSIISTSNLGYSNGYLHATISEIAAGGWFALIMNANDESNPTSYVEALINRTSGEVELWKYVSGTPTKVDSGSFTYATDAELVIEKSGTTYTVWYESQEIATGTISDVEIINNTIHGFLSTGDAATLNDDVRFFPTNGDPNEYVYRTTAAAYGVDANTVGIWDSANRSFPGDVATWEDVNGLNDLVQDTGGAQPVDGLAKEFDGGTDFFQQKEEDSEQGAMTFIADGGSAEFRDAGQDFADWETTSGDAAYLIVVTTDNGISWGYLGASNNSGLDIDIYDSVALSSRGWRGRTTPQGFPDTAASYEVRTVDFNVTTAFSWWGWVEPVDGQPGDLDIFVAKWEDVNNLRAFIFFLLTDGKIEADFSDNGFSNSTFMVTDAAVFSNGGQAGPTFIGLSYSTGAVLIIVNGVSVAITETGTVPSSLFDTPAPFTVGVIDEISGILFPFEGQVHANEFRNTSMTEAEFLQKYTDTKKAGW